MQRDMTISVSTPIDALPGISTVRKKSFLSLGITCLGELTEHFPRGYQARGNIRSLENAEDGVISSFILTVGTCPKSARLRGNLTITKFKAFDDSGSCEIIFFNRAYADKSYPLGSTHRFYGKVTRERGAIKLNSPESEPYFEGAALIPMVPIYPLSAGLTQKLMRSSVRRALDLLYRTSPSDSCIPLTPEETLPSEIRRRYALCSRSFAYENIHFPSDEEALKSAGRRLAFEELFMLSLKLGYTKHFARRESAPILHDTGLLARFFSLLPFKPTQAQVNVCDDIRRDLELGRPMSRLIAGDVGSGKTMCAAAAAYLALGNGYQAAIMAPTEILARQHYKDIGELLSRLGVKVELLVGATKQSEKKRILASIAEGETGLVIGTHTLIGDSVRFKSLALVVTDEQHRFGVRQRAALGGKAAGTHVLVMSATPIPRSLALILYGDLDISRIDELPPGRQKVDTFVVNESFRDRLNAFIRKQVEHGNRVYIVCPSVEEVAREPREDENIDIPNFFELSQVEESCELKSAVEYAKKLREEVFPDLGVGYIHGRMKSGEKQAAMDAFVRGETQILVSTTVIEVGVNVPEATLMIIENAERYGLSQLHQLRGRVGRGKDKSYCVLVSNAKAGSSAAKRLEVMRQSSDGYTIAEKDLEQRGPGDFFDSGDLRQHGRFKLKLASFNDAELILDASKAASDLLERDPTLELEEHAPLLHALDMLERARESTFN